MENFYARTVFFVTNAEEALAFYTKTLGFTLDWNHEYEGKAWVFQVGFFGFELILNQAWGPTKERIGHGRVFLGLEEDQAPKLLQHIKEQGISVMKGDWGRPTLVIRDQDGNELFFWIPDEEWANLPSDLPVIDAG